MNNISLFLCMLGLLISCKPKSDSALNTDKPSVEIKSNFKIAFGSCNKQYEENILWDDILNEKPDAWIWGGDIVYASNGNVQGIEKAYNKLRQNEDYQELKKNTSILATWDDHDYGLNDGGESFEHKNVSKGYFLDFLDVPKNDKRRLKKGIYYSEKFENEKGTVQVFLLDTRYFRTKLTRSGVLGKRYKPNEYGKGTVLGEMQWEWLEQGLKNSNADFNILVSSIQFLSSEHGFESWGNMPHEVDRMKNLIVNSQAKGVFILSGDRHISEFSQTEIEGLNYPLTDFTSSGLTHTYTKFSEEPNRYRVGEVVNKLTYGVLSFDFDSHSVIMQAKGDGDNVWNTLKVDF